MNALKNFTLLFYCIICSVTFSQNNIDSLRINKSWYISSAIGMQMSGIKSEDFISSNYSPSYLIAIGVWFTPEIALQLSYKGNYFNTISNKDKRYYNFILGEVLLNINEIINGNKVWKSSWNIVFHSGAGYFYNHYYDRPNICGNFGIMPTIKITNFINAYVDISAIVGWDIYQENDDILPSFVLGLSYLLQ